MPAHKGTTKPNNRTYEPLVSNRATGDAVVGSLTGEWLSIHHKMSDLVSFYFGHQGYEYVDPGRAWQIALFVGLLLRLFLMIRVLLPALRKQGEQKQLVALLLICLRVLIPGIEWKSGLLKFSFWSLNIGLAAMCLLSLLPVGLMQTSASVDKGYWYARIR